VGLVYFHPENAQHRALDLFSQAAAQAEQTHGPPACRTSVVALWQMEHGVLEVRLRRPTGDGAPGTEIRYLGPGYAEEMARRSTPRPSAPRRTASGRASGPRLLGTRADSVAPPAPPEPAADSVAAPAPPAMPAVTAATCTVNA
jgi:hypothetical protein